MSHSDSDPGLYVIELVLARERRIKVGRRGVENFPAGAYFYIGSAQKNLAKRIARHRKRVKPKRWHIDYLRAHCRFQGFKVYIGKREECELAHHVIENTGGIILHPRFGATDCRCDGHLVYTEI